MMDRHMRDSLDHWLTTPPEDYLYRDPEDDEDEDEDEEDEEDCE